MGAVPSNFDATYRQSIQKYLNEFGKANLVPDGDFGPKSIAALTAFQKAKGLPATGKYDDMTESFMGAFIKNKYITNQDFVDGAKLLGVSIADVKAVMHVEAGGSGFFNTGECKILFERHIFLQQLQKKFSPTHKFLLMSRYGNMAGKTATITDLLSLAPNLVNAQTKGYFGGVREYERLNAAIEFDTECALLSASWGLGQIMGFNFKTAGYANVTDFVRDMKSSESYQMRAFLNFIRADARLLKAIQGNDWKTFARYYNGPAYATHPAGGYDQQLAKAKELFLKA